MKLKEAIRMLKKDDIFRFLQDAGIRHDDKVTVHCSLRSIGKIENGADGLIDAFSEYLKATSLKSTEPSLTSMTGFSGLWIEGCSSNTSEILFTDSMDIVSIT